MKEVFMSKDQREIARKLRILRHAEQTGHVARTCRYFGVGRSSFYRWREAYRKHGDAGLVNRLSEVSARRTDLRVYGTEGSGSSKLLRSADETETRNIEGCR
jgi:transposase-like protein